MNEIIIRQADKQFRCCVLDVRARVLCVMCECSLYSLLARSVADCFFVLFILIYVYKTSITLDSTVIWHIPYAHLALRAHTHSVDTGADIHTFH